jgi:hypothetical protein
MSDNGNEKQPVDAGVERLREISYAFADCMQELNDIIELQMQSVALMAQELASAAAELSEVDEEFAAGALDERSGELGGMLENLKESAAKLQKTELAAMAEAQEAGQPDELLVAARHALSIAYENAVSQQHQLWITAQAALTQGVTLIYTNVPGGAGQPSVKH